MKTTTGKINVGSKSSDTVSYSIQKPMQKEFDLKKLLQGGQSSHTVNCHNKSLPIQNVQYCFKLEISKQNNWVNQFHNIFTTVLDPKSDRK